MKFVKISILFIVLSAGILLGLPRHARSDVLPKKIPVTVTADKLDYDQTDDRYVAVGHVKIEQDGVRLEAEKVVLDNKTGETMAEGKVYLQDKGDIIHAERLRINLNTRDGVIVKGDLYMKKDNIHLTGDSIERNSETVYHVEKGTITTCDEGEWYLKADELNIDMDRYATGRGVSFNVAGLPVFYTPYVLFPVRRQTGFLIPELGYDSKDGSFANNAFFWNISDYKDMTLYSDYRARIGNGTGAEYRYMNSRESMGEVYGKSWDMYHTGGSRWEFRFDHQEVFAEDLSARVDINLVSDERYFSDLEKNMDIKSKPYLDSNAFYGERWDTSALYLLGQYSIDLTQDNKNTVQKLPELRYVIFDEAIAGPLHLGFEGSAVNFTREAEDGVRRVDFNPQLTAVFGSGGLSVTPKAGVRATFYDRSINTAEPTERKYWYAGMDMNARVSRLYGSDGDEGIGLLRHSIEPTLSYSYISHVDQGTIPQFDSVDAVSAQNLVSVALINRVTAHYNETKDPAKYKTFDLMVFRLSRTYDFNVAREQGGSVHPGSEVLAELFLRTPKMFSASATESYNTYDHTFSSHSESAGLTTSAVNMNFTHSYTRGNPGTEYLIGAMGLNLGKWKLNGQLWRDMEKNKTSEIDYGANYASPCWGIRIAYTNNYTVIPTETRWTVMLDLKGLGSRGQQGR